MEIRKRITIQFTTIVAILLLVSLTVVYVLFSSFRKEEFKNRLSNKAKSVAQLIAETESIEPDLLKRIKKNNPTSLPNEKIVVYNSNNRVIYSSGFNNRNEFPTTLIINIRKVKSIYIKEDTRELFGYYYTGNKESVVVICSAYDVFGYRKLNNLRLILITVFFLSLILLFFLGRVFATRALEPISDIIKQVNDIDINNIGNRVSAGSGKDEIALLADTFNNLLNRLDSAFKTQKDFIANASHELRTPLTSITGQLEVTLLKERSDEEYKQALASTLDDIKNLNRLINRLFTLLRTGTAMRDTSFADIRIDDVLWKARSEYLKHHENNNVEISFDDSIEGEHHFRLSGNYDLLKTAFINLIDNGCKYSSNNRVDINLSMRDNILKVIFKDKGIGIPENEIKNISQPFYRASNVKKRMGHGIGLSLADRIIALHNGTISISSLIDKGTTITLSLPLNTNF